MPQDHTSVVPYNFSFWGYFSVTWSYRVPFPSTTSVTRQMQPNCQQIQQYSSHNYLPFQSRSGRGPFKFNKEESSLIKGEEQFHFWPNFIPTDSGCQLWGRNNHTALTFTIDWTYQSLILQREHFQHKPKKSPQTREGPFWHICIPIKGTLHN